MAINFPGSPTIGDEFTGGGFTWTWNGSSWEKLAATVSQLNDFSVTVTSDNTTYTLDRSYQAGMYSVSTVDNDSSFDIYAVSENGAYAGYTNNSKLRVTDDFNQISIFGIAENDIVTFYYRGTVASGAGRGNSQVSGAYVTEVSPVSMPNVESTTTVTGGNFANDVEVYFVNNSGVELPAKSLVRSSSTELIATRPDVFPINSGPYDIKVVNPGIPLPTGTNNHKLVNALNAGTFPTWSTGTSVNYNVDSDFEANIDLVASDTENSQITYSIASGSLPPGLTLNSQNGKISGTFSGTAAEGDSTSVTFRATDEGGNFVDKTINLVANTRPVWSSAPALGSTLSNTPFSTTVSASSGSQGGAIEYSLVSGSLPAGLSLNSSTGAISGSSTDGGYFEFTVRATELSSSSNLGQIYTDQTFNIFIASSQVTIDSSQSFTVPAGISAMEFTMVGGGGHGGGDVGGGGGGGGASKFLQLVSPGESLTLTVGAGSGISSVTGSTTTFTVSAPAGANGRGFGTGGNGGSGNLFTGGKGGDGAYASGAAKDGASGYTLSETGTMYGGGGGGGLWNNPAGSGGAGGGGAGGVAGTANTGGGGGGSQNVGRGSNAKPGGSGRIIIRY